MSDTKLMCPSCGSTGRFYVYAEVRLTVPGSDYLNISDEDGGREYGSESPCSCVNCNRVGRLGDFYRPDVRQFSIADADRLLGLADQFLEDWKNNEGKNDAECQERVQEFKQIRPLLVQAPRLLEELLYLRSEVKEMAKNQLQGDLGVLLASAEDLLALLGIDPEEKP